MRKLLESHCIWMKEKERVRARWSQRPHQQSKRMKLQPRCQWIRSAKLGQKVIRTTQRVQKGKEKGINHPKGVAHQFRQRRKQMVHRQRQSLRIIVISLPYRACFSQRVLATEVILARSLMKDQLQRQSQRQRPKAQPQQRQRMPHWSRQGANATKTNTSCVADPTMSVCNLLHPHHHALCQVCQPLSKGYPSQHA